MCLIMRLRDMPVDPPNCALTLYLRFFGVTRKTMCYRQSCTSGTTPSGAIREETAIGIRVT
ncbi:hypothetical protein D3C85_1820670 [compost metagenome]